MTEEECRKAIRKEIELLDWVGMSQTLSDIMEHVRDFAHTQIVEVT